MTGATSRVEECQFFRVQAGRRDCLQFILDVGCLLGRLNVILHLLPQGRLRIRRQPLPTKRVLHEVFDDPVWRKKLSGSRDVLASDYLADHLILLLRDVELVQPTDDLNLLPVLFVNFVDQLADQ